jgi:hypothetical protein
MLDKQTRGAILLLRSRGHSLRCISRLLSLSGGLRSSPTLQVTGTHRILSPDPFFSNFTIH